MYNVYIPVKTGKGPDVYQKCIGQGWGCSSVVQSLSGTLKAQGSIAGTVKRKENKKAKCDVAHPCGENTAVMKGMK